MQKWLSSLGALAAALYIQTAQALPTYGVVFDDGDNSLRGSITTKGYDGYLSMPHIVAWQFHQQFPGGNFDIASTDAGAFAHAGSSPDPVFPPGKEIWFASTTSLTAILWGLGGIIFGTPNNHVFLNFIQNCSTEICLNVEAGDANYFRQSWTLATTTPPDFTPPDTNLPEPGTLAMFAASLPAPADVVRTGPDRSAASVSASVSNSVST